MTTINHAFPNTEFVAEASATVLSRVNAFELCSENPFSLFATA